MRRRGQGIWAASGLLMAAPALTSAATWTLVGTSSFTSPNAAPNMATQRGTNSGLMDPDRIKFHSIVVDGVGDVYATAGYNAENTSNTAAGRSGVTVFPAGGGQVDIDLTAFPGDGNYAAGRAIAGGILKMVVGGDGHVYAMLAYHEINAGFTAYTAWKNKIVRFRRDSNNPGQYLSEVIFDFNTERALLGYAVDESNPDRDVIGGMTVGPDGHVYWTCGQNLSNIWKFRFLYRFNTLVVSNTAPEIAAAIERSPLNCGIKGDVTAPNCTVAQGSTNERMFNLEAVGTDTTLTDPNKNWFAVLSAPSVGGAGQTWAVDGMTWNTGRSAIPVGNNGSTGTGAGVWWRDWYTATAYDPVRKKLWLAGRSRNPNAGTNNSGRPWEINSGDSANLRNPLFIDSTATNLVEGNPATVLRVEKINNTTNRNWRRKLAVGQNRVTLGSRFRVAAYSADFTGSIMHISARTPDATAATAQVALAIDATTRHLVVQDAVASYAVLADLTPTAAVDPNVYYEVHMYTDTVTPGQVKIWVDGTLTTVTGLLRATDTSSDHIGFGAGAPKSLAANNGTATIYFDWIGMSNAEVAGGASPGGLIGAGNYHPESLWPSQAISSGGILGSFLAGDIQPHEFNSSNVMVRINGDITHPALFQGSPPASTSNLAPISAWATNGNNPGLLDGGTQLGGDGLAGCPASNQPNGLYWVSALAINPCDGAAWMSWSGAGMYETTIPDGYPKYRYIHKGTYGPIGKVYRVAYNGTIYDSGADEGAPLASDTSAVIGLTFKGTKVYALVIDYTTDPATYKVYSTTNTSNACCNDIVVDSDADTDVDFDDFGAFQQCYKANATNSGGEIAYAYGTWSDGVGLHSCRCFDRDPGTAPNGLINDADFLAFRSCETRAGMPQSNISCK